MLTLLALVLAQPAIDPMAPFARLLGGEWKQTALSGKSMYHAWHWGPGRHSVRRTTDGESAGGEPWREEQVYYWHPGRKQVRMLGLSPYSRGVFEGSFTFDGETAEGRSDLFQTGRRRRIGHRWAFAGPDRFRDSLLEATAGGDYATLVEFDLARVKPPAVPRPRGVEGAKLADRLKPLEPLLRHAWAAEGDTPTVSTVEWVPLAELIYVRVVGTGGDHLLDAYLYHHTGADVLRCLALSARGSVYEGDITAADGGLSVDLVGHEGGPSTRYRVRVTVEPDGTIRQRVSSGPAATPVLDIRHTPKKG